MVLHMMVVLVAVILFMAVHTAVAAADHMQPVDLVAMEQYALFGVQTQYFPNNAS
jgi:opacity protein-like surface antigen